MAPIDVVPAAEAANTDLVVPVEEHGSAGFFFFFEELVRVVDGVQRRDGADRLGGGGEASARSRRGCSRSKRECGCSTWYPIAALRDEITRAIGKAHQRSCQGSAQSFRCRAP